MVAQSLGIFCYRSFPSGKCPAFSLMPLKIPHLTNGFRLLYGGGELAPGWEEFPQAETRRKAKALESLN